MTASTTDHARLLLLLGLLAVVGAALTACASDDTDEIEAVTQEAYLADSRAFEAQRVAYIEKITACAEEQGIAPEVTWDQGILLPDGLDQDEAEEYWDVVGGCADDIYPPERELAAEEIEEQYALLLAAKQCLRAQGYDTGEPTDFEEFRERYEAGGGQPPWSPYATVAQDPPAFREAVEACPQPGRF